MPAFRFEAIDAAGKAQKGVLDADSARSARAQLRGQGLTPLVVEPAATVVVGRYGVVHVGVVVSTLSFCAFTQPLYDGVIVGRASPYVTLAFEAVTTTPLRLTVTAPST